VFLPGEASSACGVWFQSTIKDAAPDTVTCFVACEESAEGIVVVSKSVSIRRLLGVGEEYGQSVRSKARTWRASVNRFSLCLQATGIVEN
jgi:hypothetical protein